MCGYFICRLRDRKLLVLKSADFSREIHKNNVFKTINDRKWSTNFDGNTFF